MKYETNILSAATLIAFGVYPINRNQDIERATIVLTDEYDHFICPAASISVHDYSTTPNLESDYRPTVANRQHEFDGLVAEWRRATGKLSIVEKAALHPAYQRIIGMGEQALPLIFAELDKRGGHWLWALEAITGRDDIAKEGDTFREAVSAWLQWGRTKGYL